jgi:hypothetical protein
MLRILERRDSRETRLFRQAERSELEPRRGMGVYLGTDPDLTAVQSTILRLL